MGLVSFIADKITSGQKAPVTQSIYDFKIPALNGDSVDFSQYRGKKLLIVNTASKCGFTPQYADLEKLHETYGDKVVVLGFPANNFLWQEPGSNEQIAKFFRPIILGFILCVSHSRTFSLIHGYSAPLEIYKHLQYHEDAGDGELWKLVYVLPKFYVLCFFFYLQLIF